MAMIGEFLKSAEGGRELQLGGIWVKGAMPPRQRNPDPSATLIPFACAKFFCLCC
jgi:hypothetical protein